MSTRSLCTVLAAATALALPGGALRSQGGQSTPLVVAPADAGVVLRWAWPASGERPAGYHVERRAAGEAWTRLTTRPLARVRDRAAARDLLGASYARYEPLLFPTDPRGELADPESYRSLVLLAADVEPGVAAALGLRYDDRQARAGARYEYRLVAVERGGGERVAATSAPVAAGVYEPAPAPGPLQAAQGRVGVELRWGGVGGFSAYNVYRGVNGGVPARLNAAPVVLFSEDREGAGGVSPDAPVQLRDTAVAAGDVVRYAVEGIDAFGRASRRTPEVTVVVRDLAPPSAPGPVMTTVRGDTVVVTWGAPPDADVASYQLWRGASHSGPFERVGAPVRAPERAARDHGRPARRLLWYRVTAADRDGNEGEPSFVAMAEVPDLAPPPAPNGVAGTAATGLATLRWSPAGADDVLGYRVYRASAPNREFALLTPQPVARSEFADMIRVGADHPFFYRVTAVDSAYNESAPSGVVSLRPPDVRPPSPPAVVAVEPGEERLAVRWLANPEPDVIGYRLRWRPRGDSVWAEARDTVPAGRRDYVIGFAPAGRVMEVAVLALDDAGNRSAWSRPLTGAAYKRTRPAPAEVRRAAYDAKAGGVVVEWKPPADGAARVAVLRRDGGDSTFRRIAVLPAAAGRFVDSAPRPGGAYEYALRTIDRFGNSSESPRRKHVAVPAPGGAR